MPVRVLLLSSCIFFVVRGCANHQNEIILWHIANVVFCCCFFRQSRCRLSIPGQQCEVGLRRKTYYVLSGSLLGVWSYIEGTFYQYYKENYTIQIVRVRTDSKRLVGKLLCSYIELLSYNLKP